MPNYIIFPMITMLAMTLATIDKISDIGLSALPLAIIFGMTYGHISSPVCNKVEQSFAVMCKQKSLRIGIVLFGFGLSFSQLFTIGWQVIVIDLIIVSTIFTVGSLVGTKVLKLPRDLSMLTAAGSAICGAAAILAIEPVVRSSQKHTSIAIASVVFFGTLAMFSYPIIYQLVDISDHTFGVYIGSTVHEVAQATAAGQSISSDVMQTAVVVKLVRVMMLAPFILMLGVVLNKRDKTKIIRANDAAGVSDVKTFIPSPNKLIIPWFVFGFIIATVINTIILIPEFLQMTITFCSQFLLALAMVALGAETQWSTIRTAGSKPLILALILFVILMLGGFFLSMYLT
jgi:uncharacterized integral membrane protein (TIGR00698 family)